MLFLKLAPRFCWLICIVQCKNWLIAKFINNTSHEFTACIHFLQTFTPYIYHTFTPCIDNGVNVCKCILQCNKYSNYSISFVRRHRQVIEKTCGNLAVIKFLGDFILKKIAIRCKSTSCPQSDHNDTKLLPNTSIPSCPTAMVGATTIHYSIDIFQTETLQKIFTHDFAYVYCLHWSCGITGQGGATPMQAIRIKLDLAICQQTCSPRMNSLFFMIW